MSGRQGEPGYRLMTQAAAIVPRPISLISAGGSDAASFLHGQLAADVEVLGVGDSAETLLLTPKGRIEAIGVLLRRLDDEFAIFVDTAAAESAVDALNRFKLRVDVDISISDLDAAHIVGPDVARVCEGAEIAVAYPGPIGGMLVAGTPDDAPDVPMVSSEVFDSRRIEVGEMLVGVDIFEKTIPHEAGLVPRAASLEKGCYTGQELIERIHSRGHPNRVVRSVRLSGDAIPPPGTEVVHAGKSIGTLTTTAHVFAWDRPGGLGLLRVEVDPGTGVSVGDAAATVVAR